MNGEAQAPALLPLEESISNFKSLLKKKRNPPFIFGILVHLTVAVEMVMGYRLATDQGTGRTVLPQTFSMFFLLLAAQIFYVYMTGRVAAIYGKKARLLPMLAFFQTGLVPLLLILPAFLVLRSFTAPSVLYVLVGVLLAGRVLQHWRDTIQTSFRMTRFQSGLAMAAAAFSLTAGAVLLIYMVILSKALAFL